MIYDNSKNNVKNTTEDVLNIVKEHEVLFVRLQFIDILGFPKNIVIPSCRLDEALDEGMPFDASSIAGYATIEESDKIAKPDPTSFVILPDSIEKRRTAKMNCKIYEPNGSRFTGDTQYILEQIVEKAKKMGYDYNTGPECEFFLFKKNGEDSTLIPNDMAGYFDLSHRDLAEGVRADISLALEQFGITTYTSHHEVSPGQHEINFQYSDALTTADRVISLKYVTKVIATQHGLHASFMPKPIHGFNGSGMHTHQSLFTFDGENAFYDPDDKNQLSQIAYQFIAGLLKYIKDMSAILNPTVNSYKRLVPGFEAPTYISWANRNRSALIRIPSKRGKSTRCELRNPDVSGNPYLQFAVMLAAGLQGIKDKLEPPEAVEKNIYELTPKERKKYGIGNLPESLGHALSFMESSDFIRETIGAHVFENFLHVKQEQWAAYRTQVTKWETDHYLPII
ncbi:MAG: type I glutamate--ammonia ligase [Candidatus Thermoplasmatota archaeon]|nr:type I glutamate--ammonia ligase [Candidatus Thermoplasmatota archaeon]MBU1940643.1 type I glutamate--ammonia ligase [Candidatus Thermoplasmatota archaeon]